MPKLNVDMVQVVSNRVCLKCGSSDNIARHHTGCERMWLRHFASRSSTKRYRKFKERYEAFKSEDIILLCEACHRLIHDLYYVIICYEVQRLQLNPGDWSWTRAELLMTKLRKICKIWLQVKPLQS